MFWIFNKDKIVSSIIAVFTVFILFLTASAFTNNDTVTTSANTIRNKQVIMDNSDIDVNIELNFINNTAKVNINN